MEQRTLYFSINKDPKLHMSYCVFMDVLGFNQIVAEGFKGDNPETIFKQFYQVISEQVQILHSHREANKLPSWEIKVFTDNIVLGYPVSSPEGEREFSDIVAEVADYQLAMALNGFFVRGGLSYGYLFMDEYTVYGPAILDAYSLESKKARDPRIVLSENVHELVQSFTEYYEAPQESPYNKAILIDPDGQAYINYLEGLTSVESNEESVHWESIKKHKANIEKGLEKHYSDPLIWLKFYWLANYHDYFCDKYSHVKGYDKASLIEDGLAKRHPSRLVEPSIVKYPAADN